jgi:hypothetical protein
MSSTRRIALALGSTSLIAAASLVASGGIASAQSEGRTPAFLQPDRCYRIAFPIEGAPNYKVLERLDGGWVRAEVDAGPASANRLSMWINTSQIITARETPCGGGL